MGAGIRICLEYWLGNGFNAQGLGFDYKIIQNGIELEFKSKIGYEIVKFHALGFWDDPQGEMVLGLPKNTFKVIVNDGAKKALTHHFWPCLSRFELTFTGILRTGQLAAVKMHPRQKVWFES